jgi:hypothetical protein
VAVVGRVAGLARITGPAVGAAAFAACVAFVAWADSCDAGAFATAARTGAAVVCARVVRTAAASGVTVGPGAGLAAVSAGSAAVAARLVRAVAPAAGFAVAPARIRVAIAPLSASARAGSTLWAWIAARAPRPPRRLGSVVAASNTRTAPLPALESGIAERSTAVRRMCQ